MYAMKVAHIVNFCTKKGAVRGNEAKIGQQTCCSFVNVGRICDAVVGRGQGEYAVKGDICGADQQALDISDNIILCIHDLLPAKDMFLVLYGKDVVINIGIKRKRIIKGRKEADHMDFL